MNREDFINQLVNDLKINYLRINKIYRILSFLLIFGVFLIVLSIYLYSLYSISIIETFNILSSIFTGIFLISYIQIGFHNRYIYGLFAIIFNFLALLYLGFNSIKDIMLNGFPSGVLCLFEIFLSGLFIGLIIWFSLKFLYKTYLHNYWILWIPALYLGLLLIEGLCEIDSISHNFIWHGLLPFFVVLYIYFKKL